MDEQILENIPTEPEITVEENPIVEPVVNPEPIPPELYTVYIQIDNASRIIAINSSAFLPSAEGWIEIDSGAGDRYHHAQGNYFPKPIITDGGAYRYKLVDGKPVECATEELAAQEEALKPVPTPSLENRVEVLETDAAETREALEMILSGVTE